MNQVSQAHVEISTAVLAQIDRQLVGLLSLDHAHHLLLDVAQISNLADAAVNCSSIAQIFAPRLLTRALSIQWELLFNPHPLRFAAGGRRAHLNRETSSLIGLQLVVCNLALRSDPQSPERHSSREKSFDPDPGQFGCFILRRY